MSHLAVFFLVRKGGKSMLIQQKETNISHRKIIFQSAILGDMLVSRRIHRKRTKIAVEKSVVPTTMD